jgi:hypothetical protein
MENNHLFAKKFAWCLVPFCKIIKQNPKVFGIEREQNPKVLPKLKKF